MHHHLVREGTRLRAGLVIESGEPREVHHMACLIGYGAAAVNPYLMLEGLGDLHRNGELPEGLSVDEAERNVIKAIGKGLLKVISKMGISTIHSYCGAQIFEAVGLDPALVERYFTGTTSRIGGIGIGVLATEALAPPRPRVSGARRASCCRSAACTSGAATASAGCGTRRRSRCCSTRCARTATRTGARETYDRFAALVNEENARHGMLRGLLRFRADLEPVPLEEVEPAAEIVKRFSTGGMSLGALSPEAHETLAIAMNRLGGQSNTGEGGEDERRYRPDANGDLRRSAIKQVASGRFGVTIDYLVNADQLQIKVAQGAKPGEGGQLPGHKVDRYIAEPAPLHARRGADLAAAAPRHLLDRGPQAAHLRPALRQPARAGVGQARGRGRRRHGRRGRGQGERRPRHDRRPRRRHRRLAAVLDPARRRAVGDRAGRDPADAAGQRPALAHRRAGRRPDAHRPRRGDRRRCSAPTSSASPPPR